MSLKYYSPTEKNGESRVMNRHKLKTIPQYIPRVGNEQFPIRTTKELPFLL